MSLQLFSTPGSAVLPSSDAGVSGPWAVRVPGSSGSRLPWNAVCRDGQSDGRTMDAELLLDPRPQAGRAGLGTGAAGRGGVSGRRRLSKVKDVIRDEGDTGRIKGWMGPEDLPSDTETPSSPHGQTSCGGDPGPKSYRLFPRSRLLQEGLREERWWGKAGTVFASATRPRGVELGRRAPGSMSPGTPRAGGRVAVEGRERKGRFKQKSSPCQGQGSRRLAFLSWKLMEAPHPKVMMRQKRSERPCRPPSRRRLQPRSGWGRRLSRALHRQSL